jgi:hypothetical protein
MAVQEAVERLQRTLEIEDEEETNEGEDNEETKKASEAGKPTVPIGQLLILVDLYASGESQQSICHVPSFIEVQQFQG